MVMMLVMVVVMKDYVALVRGGIRLLRMSGDVALLGGFRLYGCWSRRSHGMHVHVAVGCGRLLLKGDVRTPEPIVTGAFAVWLPDVSILLHVHLVAIKGIGNGPSITRMPDGKSTLWIPWRDRWRTSYRVSH